MGRQRLTPSSSPGRTGPLASGPRAREPDPARPDEFVGTRSFAAGGDVVVGDRFRLVTVTQDQADRSGVEALFKEEPEGPSLDAVLVGIADGPLQINDPMPHLARIRAIPFLLAGLVALRAVLTVVHVILTSLRNRRRDVAILQSLWADGPWVSRAVHWQATTFSLVPLAIGVPLGLSAGRVVFDAFVDRVGAVPDASFPLLLLTVVVAGFVLLANAVAALPARRALRLQRPAAHPRVNDTRAAQVVP